MTYWHRITVLSNLCRLKNDSGHRAKLVGQLKLGSVTRDTRHATATATLFATHVFLCMCSVRRDKRHVARDVSPATFGIATCSDRWRDFLEVARHCDIICTKYRSLTWVLRCPSLRIAVFGWTVHDLFFKRFAKGWQLIQQDDIDVPRVCLYWCRGWNFHHRFLFDLRCTGI